MELPGRRNNVRPQMRFIIQCDNKVHKKQNKNKIKKKIKINLPLYLDCSCYACGQDLMVK